MKLGTHLPQASHARTEETFRLYLREAKRIAGWIGTRDLTPETVQDFEAWARSRFKPDSLSNKTAAWNLWLAWKGVPYRIRRPPKDIAANPKLVSDAEYRRLLETIADREERLCLHILHDTGFRPSDVVDVRRSDLAEEGGILLIRRRTQKTGTITESVLTKETADELRAFVLSAGVTDYVFRGETDKPHRHRTWPNAVLRKHHAEGITPRTFRRTLATNWGDDLKSLLSQPGWSDPKTILLRYRRDVRERHVREFERAVGPAKDPDPESSLPGYG